MGSIGPQVYSAVQEPRTKVRDGRAAVFFDRDGTLIEDVGYLRNAAGLQMIPGAGKAIRALNERDFLVFVVSNQSGVARELFSEADLVPIHQRLETELARDHARLDRIYYCPHHPTIGKSPYTMSCECRKPQTGMLRRAMEDFPVNPRRAFVVGDKVADMKAGLAAGARTVLVLTGYGPSALQECQSTGLTPDAVRPSVVEAVEFILQQSEGDVHYHA